ncbi:hydantoinase/oxoprolinase family protein [Methanolobus psychrotolerans]|uniref:hydantoinase/oxoprolinase family protein n=1 Tax=Methanolobus psychrotolerans TaxID=1874706 RepID=UPI000B9182D8|nr:hydantoinase/oxoprolinase family protein [Methanolobus psychrotolerans]
MRIIGVDIGGANTKIASADGEIIELHYIPLWKDTTLPASLEDIAEDLQPDKVSVVMTGELADCFEDKLQGIDFIMRSVNDAFDCEVKYIDNSGYFYGDSGNLRDLAAANWAASTRLIGSEIGDCIFVDVGSTTSDIIPIKHGKHVAGLTDFSRLVRSELFYAGTLRTNLAYLLEKVKVADGDCHIASELFSTNADAYLLLGDISEDLYTCETADGAGKSKTDAMRRLARVVCADLTEISADEIYHIAQQVKERQLDLLSKSISVIAERNGLDRIVSAGIGEFLIKDAAERLGFECISVAKRWGPDISKVFPAYAAAKILEDEITASRKE